MGVARKALKYSAAGVLTTMYGLGIAYAVQTDPDKLKIQGTSRNKVVVTGAALTAMTWTATLL